MQFVNSRSWALTLLLVQGLRVTVSPNRRVQLAKTYEEAFHLLFSRYEFHDKALLALAVTHASVGEDNNKRLQFLGRPVLEVLVREHLYMYGDKKTAPSSEARPLRLSLVPF